MPRNLLFCTFGSEKYFAAKRKNGRSHLQRRSHIFSFFNECIYEYGDKVKLLISWKSVGFKLHFDGKVYKGSLIRWKKCEITGIVRLKKCKTLNHHRS